MGPYKWRIHANASLGTAPVFLFYKKDELDRLKVPETDAAHKAADNPMSTCSV
jgi:hypothetical protein